MKLLGCLFFGHFLLLFAYVNGKTLHGIPGYGRNLIVKALPAIGDYQSNVYEGYGQPQYQLTGRSEKQIDLALAQPSPGLQAVVFLTPDAESGVSGELVFTQLAPHGPVRIEGNITGLASGLHGVHIHQSGVVKDNCKDIGPHFIAYYGRHGGPRDPVRHVGDLGNIKAEEGATLKVKLIDHLISLTGPRSVVGRALAITASEDDYGRANTEESGLSGTSGPPVACGIIGYLR